MSDDFDDVLARVAGASSAIRAEPVAGEVVRGALRRRQRRRAIAGSAGAAVAVAAVAATLVVATGLSDRDDTTEPAAEPTSTGAVSGGLYRPAGFFQDLAGGTAVPMITRNHVAKGVNLTQRFNWTPDDSSATRPYLGGLALERYVGAADAACAELAGGAASCETTADGAVLGSYTVPADGAFLAPVRRAAAFSFPDSAAVLRGVTYFRPDQVAVSVVVCTCNRRGGLVLSDDVPVSDEVLAAIVSDDSWIKTGG